MENLDLQKKPYMSSVRGIVRHGNKRGRTLGYPTANQFLHRDLADGVYISITNIHGNWRPSMTFIGAPETFGITQKKIETTVLDFSGDLYDKWLTVRLLKKIRGSKKFRSVEELVAAIKKDEENTRRYFE